MSGNREFFGKVRVATNGAAAINYFTKVTKLASSLLQENYTTWAVLSIISCAACGAIFASHTCSPTAAYAYATSGAL
jgi:hypothetical protein